MADWVSPITGEELILTKEGLRDSFQEYGVFPDGIPNLIYPAVLEKEDQKSFDFYKHRAEDYERYLHLTFETYNEDELEVRSFMIDHLNLQPDFKVLEIACGTGRDSILIADRLDKSAELWLTDISHNMIHSAKTKLEEKNINSKFAVSNAIHLPCPDNYFDAIYSFGALGEFSDPAAFFSEVVRVSKPGARVVVGDENLPIWQRHTEFGRILANYNEQFLADIPFSSLPIEARKVRCQWIIGGVFYLIDFSVGEGEPTANFNFEIPGVRGGTHLTRYYGKLEGVKPATAELAWEAQKLADVSMHQWLDTLIRREALNIIKKSK